MKRPNRKSDKVLDDVKEKAQEVLDAVREAAEGVEPAHPFPAVVHPDLNLSDRREDLAKAEQRADSAAHAVTQPHIFGLRAAAEGRWDAHAEGLDQIELVLGISHRASVAEVGAGAGEELHERGLVPVFRLPRCKEHGQEEEVRRPCYD